MDSGYRLTTLPNGVRIATAAMPGMKSASVGIWATVGSRHESVSQGGIAHFTEHLLFKGTKRRNALAISEAVESLGGYLNAFTTEDHTCYYAKAGAKHLDQLCDVLADMYLNSTFAPAEIRREREVIREEILMYKDQPAQHVQELLSEALWPGHPLGRPLTGTLEGIAAFRCGHFQEFVAGNYNGRNTIATVAGNVDHDRVVQLMSPALSKLPKGRRARFAKAPALNGRLQVVVAKEDTEQTQLAMGFHAFGRRDPRRFALKLLSVILGENMSSRLFQKLREEHGYCYSVSTGMVTLDDTGSLNVWAGLDHGKLEKAIRMILKELEAICARKPSRVELRKAQDYTVGQTLMGLESTSNQMTWIGESLVGHDRILDPAWVEEQIQAVTPEAVQAVAKQCLKRQRLGVAVMGPAASEQQLRSWLR